LILNIYTWIFPAAVFAAAGLSNLSSCVKRKRNPMKARSNRIVWFSLNISTAFCFLGASVFFVEWSQLVLSATYLYYFLTVLIIFYLGFLFKYFIGLPLVFIISVSVLFFNLYLQDWGVVPEDDILGRYRILSNDQGTIKAELSILNTSFVFIEEENGPILLDFEFLEIDRTLFFISGNYYRMAQSLFISGLSDKLISFLVDSTFFLSEKKYSVVLLDRVLLSQYQIILDADGEKIFVEAFGMSNN